MLKYFAPSALMLVLLGAGCLPNMQPDNGSQEPAPGDETPICQNTCGNGTCEEIVCQGSGCPCVETADSCPQDCGPAEQHMYLDLDNHALRDVEINGTGFTYKSPITTVESPLIMTGQAQGWYFEASFPITVVDAAGKVIGSGHAQAQSDWMTEEYVPFEATVTFTKPTTATGKIIFAKDNPSGLPEHDESIEVPVAFE